MSEQGDTTRKMTPYLPEQFGGATDKGPVRKANEDAFMLPAENAPTELGHVYTVADGVGGQDHGAEASRLAVQIIHDLFYQTRQVGEPVAVALRHATEQANLAIYDEAQARGEGRMGCTVVTAVHHQNQRTILHAGDARAYLLRDGELRQITRDDTWVQRQVEEGLIGEDTAAHHELRHVITRVLGNKPDVELTISEPMPIEAGDVVLLCSDGLHDPVSLAKMQSILTGYPPQTAAEMLVMTAVQNNAKDNITAVVIHSGKLASQEEPTIIMPTVVTSTQKKTEPEMVTAVPQRQRNGIRLPLWALGLLFVLILAGLGLGVSALWRQARAPEEALPTVAPLAATPVEAIIPNASPTAAPLPPPTVPPPPTATGETAVVPPSSPPPAPTDTPEPAPSNLACIVSPGALTFVWQDDQIVGSNCDQFAREGFVFNNGDSITIIDPTPKTVLGPDATFCQENEFIKVQSVADAAVTGWVLIDSVQTTTPEQGCPP